MSQINQENTKRSPASTTKNTTNHRTRTPTTHYHSRQVSDHDLVQVSDSTAGGTAGNSNIIIDNNNNNNKHLPTPKSIKRIVDRGDVVLVEQVVIESSVKTQKGFFLRHLHPSSNVHALGASFWGTETTTSGIADHNVEPISSHTTKKKAITPTAASPITGLFKTTQTPRRHNNTRKYKLDKNWNNNNNNNNDTKKINLQQNVSSGRILDKDTLRKSQILQNERHQQRQLYNTNRPWNQAKRFLS